MKKRLLSVFLACVMVIGLTACGGTITETASQAESEETVTTVKTDISETLVVGYTSFDSPFSPFFAKSDSDQEVQSLIQTPLVINDRQGAIIYNGMSGETKKYKGTDYTYYGISNLEVTENEDGTVYYDFKLREDAKFSDGEALTADDVIFSMYVLCDPTYDGASSFCNQPIEGLKEYRAGMEMRWNMILSAGDAGYKENEFYTEEQYNNFWDVFYAKGEIFAQEIVDYCMETGEATDVATAAEVWNFPGLLNNATAADFFDMIAKSYAYDIKAIDTESAGMVFSKAVLEAVGEDLLVAVPIGKSASSITGIQKKGDYHVRVVMTEALATSVYQFALSVAPLHYYGDEALFDIDNHSYGFPKGDLSLVRSKTAQPMGAGPYKFVTFENGMIQLEANETYFLGNPKTKYVNLVEIEELDKLNKVVEGTIDMTEPIWNKKVLEDLQTANGEKAKGSAVTVSTVDSSEYGFIGMNAEVMSVAGEKDSEASKNLRKAFGTMFCVYRDSAMEAYYGELATAITYSISAPQPTEEDYKAAFSVDVKGNHIYMPDMDKEAKFAAAKEAALGFFEAAGYTIADGMITAAPAGASMEYEVLIHGEGIGNHPSYMLCNMVKDALAEIGINLVVTDLTNAAKLWEALEAGTCAMWCAAKQTTAEPDMYQFYHPDGRLSFQYDVNDEILSQLITEVHATTNQELRKSMYQECFDIINDWAVEIPVYQKKNAIIFNTKKVNGETLTQDTTAFYPWWQEIHNVELY